MKIKSKLALFFLGISLVPLVLLSAVFYSAEKKAISANVSRHLTSVASLQRSRIESIIEQNKERLSLVTSRTQLRISLRKYLKNGDKKDQEKMIRILSNAQDSVKSFQSISVFSLDGKIVASTADRPFSENVTFNEELFVRGQSENSSDTFCFNKSKKLCLLLAGPLLLDNKLLGVMMIESAPDYIISSISDYSGLGETGEVLLVGHNKTGDPLSLTPTRFKKDAALRLKLENGTDACPLNQAFQEKCKISTDSIDYRRQPVITVAQFLEGPDWVVLVKIDKAEAYLPIMKLRNFIIGVVSVLICVVFIISIYLAGGITKPLVRLTKAAKNIARGNFDHCVVQTSADEIGILVHSFNQMSDNLKSAQGELEDKFQQLNGEVLERARAEEALRDSEERYRQIYNAPSDAIFMHDAASGAILDVNRAVLEMHGYSFDEALKLDIGSLSSGEPPYDIEHAGQRVQMSITEGAQLFEWQAKKKNGDVFWVEVALRYTEFSDQKYVIAVVRDINERKEAEKNLAAEQERLAVTLRSIGDGVITTDVTGNIVMINKIAEKLTGWRSGEAVGKSLSQVFHIINEKTGQRCENPVDKVLSTGKIIALANHTSLIAKDGSECSIADSGAPIRDQKSEIIGVVLVFRDVTEENRKEEELAKGRKLEAVGLLAGGIAHDFNNILAAILGNINLVLLSTKPEDDSYFLLQEAEKASLRAKKLTQQLLTFAKGGEPVKKLANIQEVIEDSAHFVLRGSNVRCDFQGDKDQWPVKIDQGQMSQVIQNIIINANQAMPEGGVVEVCCTNVGHVLSSTLYQEGGKGIF